MKRAHLQMQRKLARPVEVRAVWVRAVRDARDFAAAALGTATGPAGAPVDLAHLVRDLKAQNFPVEGATASLLAEAFLCAAKAVALAMLPGRREAAVRVLAEAAGALDDIIEADRSDAAARSWGRYSDL
jgi:hypothetical protein